MLAEKELSLAAELQNQLAWLNEGAQKPPAADSAHSFTTPFPSTLSDEEAAAALEAFLSARRISLRPAAQEKHTAASGEDAAARARKKCSDAQPQAKFAGGRPRALGFDDKRLIITMLSLGVSIARCARYVGCARGTIHNELARDAEFARGVLLARMQTETDSLAKIHRAAERSWRAAAWLIDRIDKQEVREADDMAELDALLENLQPVPVEEIPPPEESSPDHQSPEIVAVQREVTCAEDFQQDEGGTAGLPSSESARPQPTPCADEAMQERENASGDQRSRVGENDECRSEEDFSTEPLADLNLGLGFDAEEQARKHSRQMQQLDQLLRAAMARCSPEAIAPHAKLPEAEPSPSSEAKEPNSARSTSAHQRRAQPEPFATKAEPGDAPRHTQRQKRQTTSDSRLLPRMTFRPATPCRDNS